MILFLDPVSVNPFLVEDGVKKVMTSLLFCKLWTSCQKYMNRFDGVYQLFLGSDYKNQSGDDITKV